MHEDYIYAVARVRCKERELLSDGDIHALASAKGFDEAMKTLFDKGWGDGTQKSAEEILTFENDKTWKLIRELAGDLSSFEIVLLPTDYNNMKAAVKSVLSTDEHEPVTVSGEGMVPLKQIQTAVKNKSFSDLPADMAQAAAHAYDIFMQTQDGQLCDAVLDKACLSAMLESGRRSENELLQDYAELTVAIANIKIAVRSCKTKKSQFYITNALVPCDSLDVGRLAAAASGDLTSVYAYLAFTPYAQAAEHLKTSYTAFEKWCDDRIMRMIKGQKSNPFTIGPLFAYVVARQNEISMVRIILAAKLNDLNEEMIKERLRDMYV